MEEKERDSRDIKIGISKKAKVEEEDRKILRLNAACNKRAYVKKGGRAFLSNLHMLEKVATT